MTRLSTPTSVSMRVSSDSHSRKAYGGSAKTMFQVSPPARRFRSSGSLPGDLQPARRLFRRLAERGVPRACYEASGAGYVLQRTLDQDGFHCEVIAPSLVPSLPGDHRKTDRLDAVHLARMYRSGHLTAVTVPDTEQEAVRHLQSLVNCREAAALERRREAVYQSLGRI